MPKEILGNSTGTLTFPLIEAGAKAAKDSVFIPLSAAQEAIRSLELDTPEKAGVTFLISAEILFVSLVGYRFSDGPRNNLEKYLWVLGLPALNMAGAAILLTEMWR